MAKNVKTWGEILFIWSLLSTIPVEKEILAMYFCMIFGEFSKHIFRPHFTVSRHLYREAIFSELSGLPYVFFVLLDWSEIS